MNIAQQAIDISSSRFRKQALHVELGLRLDTLDASVSGTLEEGIELVDTHWLLDLDAATYHAFFGELKPYNRIDARSESNPYLFYHQDTPSFGLPTVDEDKLVVLCSHQNTDYTHSRQTVFTLIPSLLPMLIPQLEKLEDELYSLTTLSSKKLEDYLEPILESASERYKDELKNFTKKETRFLQKNTQKFLNNLEKYTSQELAISSDFNNFILNFGDILEPFYLVPPIKEFLHTVLTLPCTYRHSWEQNRFLVFNTQVKGLVHGGFPNEENVANSPLTLYYLDFQREKLKKRDHS